MQCVALVFPGLFLPGEEGGEGKAVHSRRGCVAMSGAQADEGQALFLNLTGPSARPEGSFKSRGSSNDSMAAGYSCPPEKREDRHQVAINDRQYRVDITGGISLSIGFSY